MNVSPLPSEESSPGTASLSNKKVLAKINNLQNIFIPSPQQLPITGESSFVIEYYKTNSSLMAGQTAVSPDTSTERVEKSLPTPQASLDTAFNSPLFSNSEFQQQDLAISLSDAFESKNFNEIQSNVCSDCHILNKGSDCENMSPENIDDHTSRLHNHGYKETRDNITSNSLSKQLNIGSPLPYLPFLPQTNSVDSRSQVHINLDMNSFDDIVNDPFEDDLTISEFAYNNLHSPYSRALTRSPLRFQLTGWNPSSPGTSSSSSHDEDYLGTIPPSLAPLPDILLEVPVYRELFHHFVNITADVLVPVPHIYDHNPFKVVLPRIAINAPHLMSLVIAYAATHRAQIVNQSEPIEMISKLLERTFDGLAKSLEDNEESKSDATLATAIMLCSYEVITAAADDRWKTHLQGARGIVVARGMSDSLSGNALSGRRESISYLGLENRENPSRSSFDENTFGKSFGPQPIRSANDISGDDTLYFLIRLFAYLDIIGSLSSPTASAVLTSDESLTKLWSSPNGVFYKGLRQSGIDLKSRTKIDLCLGLDLDMLPVFARVSALCRTRIRLDDPNNSASNEEKELEKERLVTEALELSNLLFTCCSSHESIKQEELERFPKILSAESSYNQLKAMNQCFGYAVLIHLFRRVLKFSSKSPAVQEIVDTLTMLLDNTIPFGSSTEACMIFPIFTAAAEVIDPFARNRYRQRLHGMKRFGVLHIKKAIDILEETWTSDREWIDIMNSTGWSIVLA